LIVRRLDNGFVVHTSRFSLCVDVVEEKCTYLLGIREEGDSFNICPKGRRCRDPIEGWRDLLPFSVLVTPGGAVITDGKASIGLYEVPEAVNVDMILTDIPSKRDVPIQDVRMLSEGDHVEPLTAVVYKEVHQMRLQPKWFELIISEEKVIEGRLLDEKRRHIRVGDVIKFINVGTGEVIYTKVRKLIIYENFRQMLESEGTVRVLPGLDVEEGVKVYEQFYGPEAGPVLAIGIELL